MLSGIRGDKSLICNDGRTIRQTRVSRHLQADQALQLRRIVGELRGARAVNDAAALDDQRVRGVAA